MAYYNKGNGRSKSTYSKPSGGGYKGGYKGGKHQGDEDVVSFRDGQPVKYSDMPRGGKAYGGSRQNSQGEKRYGEKRYGEDRRGENSQGGNRYEKKPYGEKRYGEDRRGENSQGEKRYDKKPYGENSQGEKRYDKKPYGEKRYGENSQGGNRYDKKLQRADGDSGYRQAPRDTAAGYENRGERTPKRGPRNRPLDGGFDRRPDNRQEGYKPYERGYDRREEKPVSKAPIETSAASAAQQDELPYLIMGRNAVREAIKSGRSIDRILSQKEPDGSLREIISLARDANIQLREVDKAKLDEMCMPFGHGTKPGNHQGIVAQVPGVEYCDIQDMLSLAKKRGEKPFIIVLDGIEDPHNLGSIIRSAVCAGAHGVIIPNRRSATVTAAACKAAAGAAEYCLVARVSNINGAIKRLKDENIWIAGADMQGEAMQKAKLEGAVALVIGSEGDGLSRLTKDNCDFLVKVPIQGPVDSLNASVAAAVLMFEKRRQDAVK